MKDLNLNDNKTLLPYLKHPEAAEGLRWYKEIPSTNTTAKLLAEEGAPHRTLVVADAQSAGRGRMGRSFYSPKDSGIYMTELYRPSENPELLSFLTMAACVCTARAIQTVTAVNPQIKWVNDLYFNGKKVCGILAESVSSGGPLPDCVVLGIGINLCPPEGGFPKEIADIAGGLFDNPPDEKIRTALIAAMADNLWELGAADSPKNFIDDYRNLSCVTGKHVILSSAAKQISGVVTGFDDFGHLLLKKDDGSEAVIRSGEISLILD